MAIYEITVTYKDEQGRTVNRLMLADAADEAALLTAGAGMLTALQGVSKCGILEWTYRRTVAVNEAPAAGSNVDPGMTFTWVSSLPVDPTSKVPDPVEAIKDGQGGILLTDPLTLAYTNLYITGAFRLNRNNPVQPTAVGKAVIDK